VMGIRDGRWVLTSLPISHSRSLLGYTLERSTQKPKNTRMRKSMQALWEMSTGELQALSRPSRIKDHVGHVGHLQPLQPMNPIRFSSKVNPRILT
jgi:hypothetical protein